jgi:hypothetical protein
MEPIPYDPQDSLIQSIFSIIMQKNANLVLLQNGEPNNCKVSKELDGSTVSVF